MERTFLPDNDPYFELIERVKPGQAAALATIISAEGSTPQVPGASALFSAEGLVCGTVGGGSVEARVERLARTALARKRSFLRSFDLRQELSEEADGVCGGRLLVLIDADPSRNLSSFKDLQRAIKARRAGCLATAISRGPSGTVKKISRAWLPRNIGPADIRRAGLVRFSAEIHNVLRTGHPVLGEEKGRRLFLEPRLPRPRLIVAGAGHVGRAVARLGEFLNFEVIVLDDRAEFANPRRFPGAGRILVGDIGRTLKAIPVSEDTYIVIVTRGHSQDGRALRACIKRRAGYIGMIGSARKIALVRDRFLNRSWSTETEWARVHTPIGLRLGSKTVEEIAVSIAAELVLVRRKIREER